jgi:hypothetical protein
VTGGAARAQLPPARIPPTAPKRGRKSVAEPRTAPISKFFELLVLGLIIGAFSLGLSFLWQDYAYKASDFFQYLTAEFLPYFSSGAPRNRLPFKMVLIDIGEDTCNEWASDKYSGVCTFLPRLPHDKLSDIFQHLIWSKPKLVVVDIDLRSERLGLDPYKPDIASFTPGERDIRDVVQYWMKDTPFLVAQPLIRIPKEDYKHNSDYVAVATILHQLDTPKQNLSFGQVEQDLRDDSVLRHFRATVPLRYPNGLDPNPSDVNRKEHLALGVCELVGDRNLCGRGGDTETNDRCPDTKLRFGAHPVCADESVQFPYVLARDIGRLVNVGVRVIEARALLATNFKPSALNDSVVIIGSTARGRGDYHFTPLDFVGGQTAGVMVIANEVVAALNNKRLISASWISVITEKIILILISTIFIFFLFWYPILRKQPVTFPSWRFILLTIHFLGVAAGAILINVSIAFVIFFHSWNIGEVVNPVTPVVAAILDIVVDLCSAIGRQVESWVER